MNQISNISTFFLARKYPFSKKIIKIEHILQESRNFLKDYSKISNFHKPRYKSREIC